MATAYSWKVYTGDGSTRNFSVTFPYISRSHVKLFVDDVEVPFTWLTDSTIQANVAPLGGTKVTVRRFTPRDTRLVDFQNGSVLDERVLDLQSDQLLYCSQEALDAAYLETVRDPFTATRAGLVPAPSVADPAIFLSGDGVWRAALTSVSWSDVGGKPVFAPVATSGAYSDLSGRPALAPVATSGDYNDLTGKPALSPVALSGDYADLSGVPVLAPVATSGSYASLTGKPALAPVATSGAYGDLTGKPELSPVATSGSYADLSGKPAFASVALSGSYNDLADKPTIPTIPTLAPVAISGAYSDLTGTPTLPVLAPVATSGLYGDLTGRPVLAAVATSGDFNDLTNKPSLPGAFGPTTPGLVPASGANDATFFLSADGTWKKPDGIGGTIAWSDISGKPTLSAVATSGAYADLTGRPSLASVAVSGSYNDLADRPTIPTLPTLAPVATSGAYADLSGKPTLATVATSGLYTDLTGRPSLSAVATSGLYTDLTGRPALASVATSGAYADLSGRPTLAAVATSGAYGDLSGKPGVFAVGAAGLAPAPASADAAKFLNAAGAWASPAAPAPRYCLRWNTTTSAISTAAGVNTYVPFDGNVVDPEGWYDATKRVFLFPEDVHKVRFVARVRVTGAANNTVSLGLHQMDYSSVGSSIIDANFCQVYSAVRSPLTFEEMLIPAVIVDVVPGKAYGVCAFNGAGGNIYGYSAASPRVTFIMIEVLS